MRCSCPECGDFMIHSETDECCVCPTCLHRCNACLGTSSILSKEDVLALKKGILPHHESTGENEKNHY